MAYKDLLLALASYPEPTPVAAIDQAVGIAGLLVRGSRPSRSSCRSPSRSASTPTPSSTSAG